MKFKIFKKDKNTMARTGIIHTAHGDIHTPAFIPVGTQATVKGLTVDELKALGIESLLCNTYHLYLRPGDKIIKKLGGLHKFMNWDRPIFTDSGGFQVFSLGAAIEHGVGKIASIFPEIESQKGYRPIRTNEPITNHHHEKFVRIAEDGAEFRSHLDGSVHFFTPEKSVEIQENLGADIIFAFDECTSPLHDYAYTKKAMERTHRWAKRCLKTFEPRISNPERQSLFGIVQGGAYRDLRERSAKFIASLDFDGFGIGGSLGKSKKEMHKILDWTVPLLPENKPKHLLGIGSVEDIFEAVERGIDTFDCVIPTRLGRNGAALIKRGALNIKLGRYLKERGPLEKDCGCYSCLNFERAYISHLFKSSEMLGPILTTIHNLYFMENLMRQIRQAVRNNKLRLLKRQYLP